MRLRPRLVAVAVAGLLIGLVAPPIPAPASDFVVRADLVATDNVGASVEMSRFSFPEASIPDVSEALIARADTFPDALASGWVQQLLGAPLLLTPSGELDARVAEELDRLEPDAVHILGGEAAVSPAVQAQLEARGFAVDRISGDTRIETAIALSEVFEGGGLSDSAFLARAFDDGPGTDPTRAFVDSIALGTATQLSAIFLTDTHDLTDATAAWLRDRYPDVIIAGGTAAVSASVENEIRAYHGGYRVQGPDRFETATALAVEGYGSPGSGEFAGGGVILVDGTNPNAWAPGFTAASVVVPVLLTNGGSLPPATVAYLDALSGEETALLVCAPYTPTGACDEAEAILKS